ncbi:hypothetical protein F5Y04DRAFT_261794 [Hypomontagnella monticulosa]|nr:hypothetical protein F5Y04DRAFT_261794 [Hypomontagnella monticulosa]
MAHQRCLAYASPARALHRVFVSDLLTRTPSPAPHATLCSCYLFAPRLFSSSTYSRLSPSISPSSTPISTAAPTPIHHIRTLTTTPALHRIVSSNGRPTNRKIPYSWVRIAAPPPDSTLSPPRRTDAVLEELNLKTHTLVMVAPPPESDEGGKPAAICRIIDNAAERAAALEAAQQARRKAVDLKELELSWGITDHDLGHKLKGLRRFLEKGLRVEVIVARKRGKRSATKADADAVVAKVREAVGEIEGAKETRKMDQGTGGEMRLFFEGPSGRRVKKRKEAEAEVEEDVGAAATAVGAL